MPSASNVVEIVVQGTCTETSGLLRNIWNIFHYVQDPTLPNPAGPVAVANQFLAALWAPIASQLSVGYVGVTTWARYIDSALNAWQTAGVPANGALALPRLTSAVAVVTPLRTAFRGKQYRGSKHFGPVAAAQVVNDELTAAAVGTWGPLLAGLTAQLNVGGMMYSPCILSRTLSQLRQDPTNIQVAKVTTALLNKTIGTMRHRKEKTVR